LPGPSEVPEGRLRVQAEVEPNDAASFLGREVAEPRSGAASAVYRSVFMQCVGSQGQARIKRATEAEVSRAAGDAPVHYLTMEPAAGTFEERLDGELLDTSDPHATHMRRLGW
jgi:hypothetical protein